MPDFMPLAPANGGDLLLMLIGVLVADLVLGLVPGTRALVPVSARVFTAIAMFFERRLNRAGRGAVTLIVRGILVLLIVVGLAVGFGFAVMAAAKFPYGWVLGAMSR